jgi:tetratricopeptide (TPR) repeat protein
VVAAVKGDVRLAPCTALGLHGANSEIDPIRGVAMVLLATVQVVLIVFFCSTLGYAQLRIDENPATTLNHDYFNPNKDPQIQWMIEDQEKYHLNPAKVYVREGKFDKALADLIFFLDRFVNHPHGLALLGAIAKLTNNPSLAIRYYEKAIRLYPQYAITHAQYGAYLADIGNVKAGIVKLKKAIEMNSNLAVAHAWLAKAYYKSGDRELARQAAAQARQLGYKGEIPSGG